MINDYDTLQASVANWLARADLTSAIPDFITLAGARINRTVRAWQRQAQATGASVNSVIPIPADLYEIEDLRVLRAGQWGSIYAVTPSALRDCTGLPTGYCVLNGEIVLQGRQDVDYELTYRAEIPALSDVATQNWLILREPGLYLYGALIEATPYIKDDQRAAVWATQFQTILDDIAALNEGARFGSAPAMAGPPHAP